MRRTLSIFWIVLAFAATVHAQLDRGTITGTVTDITGAVIPSVRVTVRNQANGASYAVVASETGRYTMPNLPAGDYRVEFEAASFKKLLRENVKLAVAEVLGLDATLDVGSVADSVEVRSEIARLQTESPEVGAALSNRQLLDLPLNFGAGNGRVAEDFAYSVAPGVAGNS